MSIQNFSIQGLSEKEVEQSREKYGYNSLEFRKENGFFKTLKSVATEPMVVLLLIASSVYFISGEIGDGIFMVSAIVLIAIISIYQDSRSRNALEKLKEYAQPRCKVIRDGELHEVKSEELVVGDSLMIEEGTSVMADGVIVHSNDFSVNESILTGESLSVSKDATQEDNLVYSGTSVVSGLAIVTVTAIGNATRLGKIGTSLEGIEEEKTPLEVQINSFVKKMVIAGAIVFVLVWAINFFRSFSFGDSLIKALTLAMSILPEEIPVAFTSFMALGAWRLMKMGVIVKQMKTVETLGSATVICTDKTGTLTENRMSLARLYLAGSGRVINPATEMNEEAVELVRLSMWASEPIPFDPMEIALHQAYKSNTPHDERPEYSLVHEYPLGGKPPLMTHVFQNTAGNRIIAAKGAPEAIIRQSFLLAEVVEKIEGIVHALAREGYRVLGVGVAQHQGEEFPKEQQDFILQFKGILAFYDPPKPNIPTVLSDFYKAGIQVKIVTGDNAATTAAIARQIGFRGYDKTLTGEELMQMPEEELRNRVLTTNVFSRMFPDAKLRIISALKANGEVVVMTGDGVNDGPALKAAHIGIAMGKRGSELAKEAASLLLVNDDLSSMVDAVAMGRKIYTNLKKAIQYIISIHIPIILTVFIPTVLGWVYPSILLPVHVIFLELIMGPTCSIIYENEPMEKYTMVQKPLPLSDTFFGWDELAISIVQGLAITVGTLFVYLYSVQSGYPESMVRTVVFGVLISANIFLTLVNRSFYYSILTTLLYKNSLVPLIITVTILITAVLLYVPPVAEFFEFVPLSIGQIGLSVGVGMVSVLWFELGKAYYRYRLARQA